MFRFYSPYVLLILLILPVFHLLMAKRKKSTLRFSSLNLVKSVQGPSQFFIRWIPLVLRYLMLILLVFALARPQKVEAEREFETRGVDIVMALDISGSMLAEDFKPVNRMAVAKEEAKKFARGRQNDRIGLIVFARKGYTQCPLTLDYDILLKLIDEIEV